MTHRDPLAISLGDAGVAVEVLPERSHPGKRFIVRSQLSIGIDQRICLSWDFVGGSARSYRILGFRRTNGFAPERSRWDLAEHGIKIIDSTEPSSKVEHLAEGEYFYTFVLRRSLLGLADVTRDLVQFSEVIPSAQHVIHRLQDTIQARTLLAELAGMIRREQNAGKDSGGRDKGITGKAQQIMAWIVEHRQGADAVKAMPEWATLSSNEQELVMAALRDALRRGITSGR
ncbi:hypothetical protein BH10ACI4_BH10ACI4_38920 [soil metagenome]